MEAMTAAERLAMVVKEGAVLDREGARTLMTSLFEGRFSEGEIAGLLTALHQRGETAAELAGFAEAMRGAVVPLPLTEAERAAVVDTCGTGGDGSGTFNISTAVALVAAAAGVKVAKHGNRGVTSKCGSADVLEALGVAIEATPEEAVASLQRHGFAFLLATRAHVALKRVREVRKSLPFRTVFNLLGPMVNPAGAQQQVMGVYSAKAVPLVAEALAMLGTEHALVVHGSGGLDELSLRGESWVAEVRGSSVRRFTVRPEDAGLVSSPDALQGGNAGENAAILRGIFAGESGPRRDVVVLNAAAVMVVAGRAEDLREGARSAAAAIDSGAVTALMERIGSG